jgi:tetratricopeptide (TPR) repeat protein
LHRLVTALGLSRNRAMTTPELHPALVIRADRLRKWRSLGWVVAIAIAIVAIAVVWLRARVNPQGLWDEAQNALKSGDLATAQAKLALIGRLRAPTEFDWSLRAQIAVANGRPDEALTALSHIAETDPLAAQALLLAGRIERQRNRIPAAEVKFRKALACDPGLIGAHKELIYILDLQLRRREVDAEFKALSRLTPLSHRELLAWALTHFSVWVVDSVEQLEAFIQADPLDRYSRLSLATAFLNSPGMQSRVEQTLEPLPRSDPLAAAVRIELKLKEGRVDEATKLLENTPGNDPNLARIRGRVALLRHDHKAAIRYFQDALTEEPYDRVSFAELGRSLLLSGDKAGAEFYLARARHLDEFYNLINWVRSADQENQPSDLTQFGRTCESAGLIDEARGWYLLAIGRDPLNTEAQQALQRLREAGRL